MNQLKKKIVDPNSGVLWVILGGASLTTLYFNSRIQDPFNSPKFWIVLLIASWLVGHLINNFRLLRGVKYLKVTVVLSLSFIASMLLALVNTDPLYTGLFGENMRRNGFLSYLALIIFFLTTLIYFNLKYINRLNKIVILVGIVLAVYGLMQISGLDFVKWNNPYNAVISTVGNPNFAAGIMSILAVLNFGAALNRSFSNLARSCHLLTVLLLLSAIVMSEALQGLLAFSIGFGFISIIYIYGKNKIFGVITLLVFFIAGLFSILGILQKGPLSEYLYKGSVTVRGYYWDAGIKMFLDKPLTGIGLDRYGAYFKEFREPGYPLNYGWDITSSNAHNVPIQMFATGGILLGLSYILIALYVVIRCFIALKDASFNNRMLIATFFGGWLAFQAQSFVSIDNLGISIWGWLLAAIIIKLSFPDNQIESNFTNEKLRKTSQIGLLQPVASSLITLSVLIFVAVLYRGESAMFQTRLYANPQDASTRNLILENTAKVVQTPLIDPSYIFFSATYLRNYEFKERSVELFELVLQQDPRELNSLNALAEIYEGFNEINKAVGYRELISKYDPWNARNLLQLGREYKFLKNYNQMREIKTKIDSFASKTNEGLLASKELIEP